MRTAAPESAEQTTVNRAARMQLQRFMQVAARVGDNQGFRKSQQALDALHQEEQGEESASDGWRGEITLYTFVVNNSPNTVDVLGLGDWRVALPAAGACALADSPAIPIGDIIGIGIILCCALDIDIDLPEPKCPPPPVPPIPVIHMVPGQHGCPLGHWHYFEYHQAPWPICINRLVKRFGGCVPPKAGQPPVPTIP